MREPRLWWVALNVGGDPQPVDAVRAALERLSAENPFLLEGRYGPDRAEMRYWEEAEQVEDACAMALRLWGEHRRTAQLPDWRVMGLVVLDQETMHRRAGSGQERRRSLITQAGSWRPFGS